MSDDKVRAEFETYAEQRNWNVRKYHGSYYWAEAARAWQVWQAAYQAGRMAVHREAEEWSKAVNKRWIEAANKPESEL